MSKLRKYIITIVLPNESSEAAIDLIKKECDRVMTGGALLGVTIPVGGVNYNLDIIAIESETKNNT